MRKNIFKIKREYIVLSLILVTGFTLYTIRATYTGLWYDEAVEYFYSRFMWGEVPGAVIV